MVEEARDSEPPLHYVERIARTKANVGWKRMEERNMPPRPMLGADTEVVLDGAIFGKPADADAARAMLARLSGRRHEVITAIALRWEGEVEVSLSVSHVTLRRLTAGEIERYIASGEPMDKAGGYAIQGRPRHSSRDSRAAIRGSWACHLPKQPRCSRASGAPCYNHRDCSTGPVPRSRAATRGTGAS